MQIELYKRDGAIGIEIECSETEGVVLTMLVILTLCCVAGIVSSLLR